MPVALHAAVDAVVHHLPDAVDAGVELGRARTVSSFARFIWAMVRREPLRHLQHLDGGSKG